MATFNLKMFSRSEMLKEIAPVRLAKLLEPFVGFLKNRGFEVPSKKWTDADYLSLIRIFMTPDDTSAKAPQALIDMLYVLDEMATQEGMDALLEGAADEGISISRAPDQSPIDIAAEVWLADPAIVHNRHAEQYLGHPRSFEYFPRKKGREIPDFKLPKQNALHLLEADLDEWFEEHRRGPGAKIFMFPRGQTVWFLVRHGQPLRREGSIDNGKPTSVIFRPERFDVVIYDQALGELRVNATSKGEKDLYRDCFGKHLLNNGDYFGTAEKYTLDPLRVIGEQSVLCEDIVGIEWIRLQEIQFRWGGAKNEIEIRKATDLFAAYKSRDGKMPQAPKIIRAAFEVKFNDSKRTRKVAISGNRIQCRQDQDTALIESWLTARGFATSASSATSEGRVLPEILVDARVVAGFADQLRGMGVAAGAGISDDLAPVTAGREAGRRTALAGENLE